MTYLGSQYLANEVIYSDIFSLGLYFVILVISCISNTVQCMFSLTSNNPGAASRRGVFFVRTVAQVTHDTSTPVRKAVDPISFCISSNLFGVHRPYIETK